MIALRKFNFFGIKVLLNHVSKKNKLFTKNFFLVLLVFFFFDIKHWRYLRQEFAQLSVGHCVAEHFASKMYAKIHFCVHFVNKMAAGNYCRRPKCLQMHFCTAESVASAFSTCRSSNAKMDFCKAQCQHFAYILLCKNVFLHNKMFSIIVRIIVLHTHGAEGRIGAFCIAKCTRVSSLALRAIVRRTMHSKLQHIVLRTIVRRTLLRSINLISKKKKNSNFFSIKSLIF